jgi:hypothetical protein
MVVLQVVPFVGYIPLGFATPTTIPFIILTIALVLDARVGIVAGIVFGITSWAISLGATDPVNILFQNPLISILPRLLFVFVIYFLAGFMKKILKSYKGKKYIPLGIYGFVSSLTHSILVTIAALIFAPDAKIFVLFFVFGALLEIVIATVGVPLLYTSLSNVANKFLHKEDLNNKMEIIDDSIEEQGEEE